MPLGKWETSGRPKFGHMATAMPNISFLSLSLPPGAGFGTRFQLQRRPARISACIFFKHPNGISCMHDGNLLLGIVLKGPDH